GVCTTPARMRLWRALMSVVEGRHPTNLHNIGHSVAPDDRRFMAGSGPILKRQGRSPSMLSVV
ncbi:hypothetical protein, partial [Paraburkholderia xenovorans]|uniref:hypothetical protein n=1 Tax=Paraburkholderia xenovorans TaxID=36873 RepID=UPI0038B8F35A